MVVHDEPEAGEKTATEGLEGEVDRARDLGHATGTSDRQLAHAAGPHLAPRDGGAGPDR
jgi:hypothetical protein